MFSVIDNKTENEIYLKAAPCMVLENYLDGAIADLEDGNIDNFTFVYSCILGLQKLGDSSWKDYMNRFETWSNGGN